MNNNMLENNQSDQQLQDDQVISHEKRKERRKLDRKMLKESLTCPICFRTFRNPVSLSCQHTFCEKPCMENLQKYMKVALKCPICYQLHTKNEIRPNFVCRNLMEALGLTWEYSKRELNHVNHAIVESCAICSKVGPVREWYDTKRCLCDSCWEDYQIKTDKLIQLKQLPLESPYIYYRRLFLRYSALFLTDELGRLIPIENDELFRSFFFAGLKEKLQKFCVNHDLRKRNMEYILKTLTREDL